MPAAERPIVVNCDGNLYYGSSDQNDSPGGLAVTRETPAGTRTRFSPSSTEALHQIDDGVTGLASGPDGSLYVACWTAVFKVQMDGTVTTLAHPIEVKGCDEDKADHKPASRLPYLRGLAVDSEGTVYAAATSCHQLIKITTDGRTETALKCRAAVDAHRRGDARARCVRLGIHQRQRSKSRGLAATGSKAGTGRHRQDTRLDIRRLNWLVWRWPSAA